MLNIASNEVYNIDIEPKNKNVLIFVHGYKNNEKEAIDAYLNIESNLLIEYNFNIPVDLIGFIWDSKDRALAYFRDLKKAKQASSELRNLIIRLSEKYTTVNVNCHSMGCFLVMKTLQLMEKENKGYMDSVYLLAGDCIRMRFRTSNSFGKCSSRVLRLVSFYSYYDRILKYVSKLARPFQKIGNHKMPIKHPVNYYSFDANMFSEKGKVRHNDYKNLNELQKYIINDIV